jgi:hypothetical protein
MGSNNFYGIWTKIYFLEHSEVFLSFRKGSANQFIDERYLVFLLFSLFFLNSVQAKISLKVTKNKESKYIGRKQNNGI